jgi:hypothetical protein
MGVVATSCKFFTFHCRLTYLSFVCYMQPKFLEQDSCLTFCSHKVDTMVRLSLFLYFSILSFGFIRRFRVFWPCMLDCSIDIVSMLGFRRFLAVHAGPLHRHRFHGAWHARVGAVSHATVREASVHDHITERDRLSGVLP